MPEHRRAVVFDLDGTLVDTAADIHAILAEVLAEAGLPAPEPAAVRAMIGDGARVLIERALAAIDQPADPAIVDHFHQRFRDRYVEVPCRYSVPYEGAASCSPACRPTAGALACAPTSRTRRPWGCCGRWIFWHRSAPRSAATGYPGIRKPDPAHLAAVLASSARLPRTPIMVGDSRNDLATAGALGVPCILVIFGYTAVPARELGAAAVVDRLADIPAAMAGLR